MGGTTSSSHGTTTRRSWTWKSGDEAIVKLMLPVYYTSAGMTNQEVATAKKSWDHISNDSSPVYLSKLSSTTFAKTYGTCKDWFLEMFYERLFDIHPLCKPMFKSAMSKGSFIHGLLSFLFTILEEKKAFHARLLQIAGSHCKKGVKAIEYGIIGEAMFWTLDHCVGKDIYDANCHLCWVKIFSSMLRVIVPVAVAHELASNEAQKNRVVDHKAAFGYTPSELSLKEQCPLNATILPGYAKAAEETRTAETVVDASNAPTPDELAGHVHKASISEFTTAKASRKEAMAGQHPYQNE